MKTKFNFLTATLTIATLVLVPSSFGQQKSKVEKALSYKPVQRDFTEYDIPNRTTVKECRLEKAIEKFKKPGFVVYDANGRLLRLFLDVNRDNNLDSWSYFKDGIEVYRDVDSDFDGRADEFRWLGTSGTRHGKDVDKNGSIDRWIQISASELAEEVFNSVKNNDTARFKKLLVSSSELKKLKLGDETGKNVANAVRAASGKFDSFTKSQKAISSRSKWTQFGSTRPSVVAKSGDNERDLMIFDHAAAVYENDGKFGQISIGTIVEVAPNNWRVLELPELVGEGDIVKNGGLFYPDFNVGGGNNSIASNSNSDGTQALVKLFEQYETIEKKLKSAKGAAEIAKLEKQRAELFMQLAKDSPQKEEQENWIRQMADTVTSAYQLDSFPNGIKFLEDQTSTIKKMGLTKQLAYVRWRIIYSEFLVGHQNGDRRARNRANEKYINDLEKFTKEFPDSSFAADGLFQLGLNAEVVDRDDVDKAIGWYAKCKKSFPNTLFGKKASGALLRLTSQGKKLPFRGKTLNGRTIDLQSSKLRGKIVIVHYWETDCDTCVDGFEELQRLGAKYKNEIQIIGANLDNNTNAVKKFLSQNRNVNWPQLHAPGGAEKSPLAIQLGVATLPMAMLVDQRGTLIESNIPVDDLDREIQRLIRRASGQANLNKSTR